MNTPNQTTPAEMGDIDRDEQFCAAVWDALKADANDLRKQQRILLAFRAALQQSHTERDRLLREARDSIAFCSGSCDNSLIARIDAHLSRKDGAQ